MHCPACQSADTYQDASLWICPACSHEWTEQSAKASNSEPAARVWRDANGNILQEGDSVTVIKDLKVKGSSSVVKVGTKVRNIHLVDGDDGHDITCKIEGFGAMNLKTEFVRKA
jgi:protein PhnA